MTIKKVTIIAIAGAVLLSGAIGIAMRLTRPAEMELDVPEPPAEQPAVQEEDGMKTLGDMENIPLYYDDTEMLLLPIRNVIEGLGGTVSWEAETRDVTIACRGRELVLRPSERTGTLNGYTVTLPVTAELINGCLYAEELLFSTYFTGDVVWHNDSRQISLQTKDNTIPLVAMKEIGGEADGRSYRLQTPVIVGLNDTKYEQNLNATIEARLREMGADFLAAGEDAATFTLELHCGLTTQNFLSLWWDGTRGADACNLAQNLNLLEQKSVTLADLLRESSMEAVRAAAGAGWTEDRYYLTAEGGLVLLTGSAAACGQAQPWTGETLLWKNSAQDLARTEAQTH